MAEVDTNMLASQHSDIRREAADHRATMQLENMKGFDRVNADVLLSAGQIRAETAAHTGEIIKESLKESFAARGDIKDSRFDVATRIADSNALLSAQIDRIDDTTMDKFFTVARDTADLRAQVIQAIDTTKLATELNSLKGIIEGQRNTTYLSDKIGAEGVATRGLINDLKYNDLNRDLIERNTALVEAVGDGRYWRHRGWQDQGQNQFAALQTQLQAFGSQLQETRQGMVNFGTMAGVGQTSSSNNV